MNIVVIGVGSHSEVVEQICNDLKYNVLIASYDYTGALNKNNYIGDILKLNPIMIDKYYFIIGVGDNKKRRSISTHLNSLYKNIKWKTIIHPHSYISENITIGVGTLICPGVSIQTGSYIGDHCIINTNASIDHHSYVDNYVHVSPNCAICGNVIIRKGTFVGASSTVIPNIKIRAWSFIKASSLVKNSTCPIRIYKPYIEKFKKSVITAIDSGWISSQGEFVIKAEKLLSNILDIKYVQLVSNGTCATHCLFLALKYKYPKITKIYVPNNVYVAAWNSVLNEYTDNYIEVMKMNEYTWNIQIDTDYIKSLEPNSAMLIVHNLGNIVNVPRLKRLRPDIIFVEDNCEGLFGKYENKYSGTGVCSLASSVSFFANKTITSGEGGAFLTNDIDVYKYIKKKINQGMTGKKYIHDIHAYNYRMTNLQAALLYDQLLNLDEILNMKKNVFKIYQKLLLNNKYNIKSFDVDEKTESANWMFAIRIPNGNYDKLNETLDKYGIETRPFFYPINKHEHLKNIKSNDDISNKLSNEIIILPSYPELSESEIEYIIDILYICVKNQILKIEHF